MKNPTQNYGFIATVITRDHYIFGAEMVPKTIIRSDGQWIYDLPVMEKQFNGSFETYGCTVFGTLNALEILRGVITDDIEVNYSDRFTYISSETSPPGNNPHIVAESVRHDGVIEEIVLPFTPDIDSLEKFRDMGNRGPELLKMALTFTKSFQFMHEWIFEIADAKAQRQAKMMECLTYSPLGVSVCAWKQRENGLYYKDEGDQDNHWTVCIGYVKGEHWIIFDSYPDDNELEIKLLEWDYDFGFAKRYHLEKVIAPVILPTPIAKVTPWQSIINWIANFIKKHGWSNPLHA